MKGIKKNDDSSKVFKMWISGKIIQNISMSKTLKYICRFHYYSEYLICFYKAVKFLKKGMLTYFCKNTIMGNQNIYALN